MAQGIVQRQHACAGRRREVEVVAVVAVVASCSSCSSCCCCCCRQGAVRPLETRQHSTGEEARGRVRPEAAAVHVDDDQRGVVVVVVVVVVLDPVLDPGGGRGVRVRVGGLDDAPVDVSHRDAQRVGAAVDEQQEAGEDAALGAGDEDQRGVPGPGGRAPGGPGPKRSPRAARRRS